jgi:hypothetical protein
MTAAARKNEALRIAAAEGFAIADHDADWQQFDLADDILIDRGPAAGKWCHTFFSWESGRFEGAVTLMRSDAQA